ncbi:MAG TPA: hypothetical protein VHJ20_21010 [Polyangia bacterium]|nr:hypothetical protein [Polyangia bacterium]
MSWLDRKAPNPEEGLSPKPRRWPAIVGVTAAAWVLLSGMLLFLLGNGQ